jgi:hypothetical protein
VRGPGGGCGGLVVQLPGAGLCDSGVPGRADAVGPAGAGLVVPDAGVRRVVRLVVLDEVMPVGGALAAAAWEGYTLVRLAGEADVTVRGRLRAALPAR